MAVSRNALMFLHARYALAELLLIAWFVLTLMKVNFFNGLLLISVVVLIHLREMLRNTAEVGQRDFKTNASRLMLSRGALMIIALTFYFWLESWMPPAKGEASFAAHWFTWILLLLFMQTFLAYRFYKELVMIEAGATAKAADALPGSRSAIEEQRAAGQLEYDFVQSMPDDIEAEIVEEQAEMLVDEVRQEKRGLFRRRVKENKINDNDNDKDPS